MGCPVDPAHAAVNHVIASMLAVFDPAGPCPPLGGGSTDVRFFAGEATPMAAWNAHNDGVGCDHPFLWVRVVRRYRTEVFPSQSISANPCTGPRAIAVEVGVGRCAVVDLEPSWDDYAREAEVSLDDSYRIEQVLCRSAKALRADTISAALDAITPYGPAGGVIAWTGVLYAGL